MATTTVLIEGTRGDSVAESAARWVFHRQPAASDLEGARRELSKSAAASRLAERADIAALLRLAVAAADALADC